MPDPNPPRITYASAGAGLRVIVFLHGIGLDGESFRPQLDACAAAGWRAVGWNMPGYGGSDVVEGLGMADSAAALAGLLDGLGAEEAVIAGHSLGGFVAQEFAARYPGRVAGLVLIGTTPVFGSKDGSFEREFVKARFDPLDAGGTMAELGPGVAAGSVGKDAPAALKKRLAETFAAVPERAYRASVTSMLGFDRRAALATVAAPTLLIAGEHDRNAPAKSMQRMAEAIPGARIVIVPGVGHCPHLEAEAEFNRLLVEFLATFPA